MHAEGSLLWHVVMHDAEYALLHLTGVGAAENDLLLPCEVYVDGVLAADILKL
jgi:hypothetical protein